MDEERDNKRVFDSNLSVGVPVSQAEEGLRDFGFSESTGINCGFRGLLGSLVGLLDALDLVVLGAFVSDGRPSNKNRSVSDALVSITPITR